jgi:AraC-like DNA-binding protein
LSLPRGEKSVGDTVYAIIRYIENNIFDIDDIRTIASSLGYSYSYISHLFKERTGVTLQRYIGLKKHEKALELLKYGNLSVTQVASQLQYKSVQSFSKAFSRTMGFPPSKHLKADQHLMEIVPDRNEAQDIQIVTERKA